MYSFEYKKHKIKKKPEPQVLLLHGYNTMGILECKLCTSTFSQRNNLVNYATLHGYQLIDRYLPLGILGCFKVVGIYVHDMVFMSSQLMEQDRSAVRTYHFCRASIWIMCWGFSFGAAFISSTNLVSKRPL